MFSISLGHALLILSKSIMIFLMVINLTSIVMFKCKKSRDFIADSIFTSFLALLIYATGA